MRNAKRILLGLLIVFIIFQAFRPAKNQSGENAKSITTAYAMPQEVKTILVRACNDCHTNHTEYPWYAEVEPVGWWLSSHVNDGKHDFNMDQFTSYRVGKQYKKLEEAIDLIKENKMPLKSYTWIHKRAILSDAEKQTLSSWFENIRDSIKAHYPADSLVIKKRK